MAAALTYAVVTPVRDEAENLQRLATSLAAQTLLPAHWVVVDDGSQDGTAEIARTLAATHPWIAVTAREGANGDELWRGRRHGRVLAAFHAGVRELAAVPDVVVKVDADVSFPPDYFERLLERFADEPDLGIAGGACYEQEGGSWVRRRVMPTHPRGAARAYRRECLDDVLALEPRMGWDGLDEVRVQLRGYTTRSFTDLAFRHHRPEGARERSRFQAHVAHGRASWYMGYRPTYLGLRALYRLREDLTAAGLVCGYVAEAASRRGRYPDSRVVRALREQQRLRTVLRRGSPP
jgi:biofilm PGA synthesis N-glycosyltransferase PgaC